MHAVSDAVSTVAGQRAAGRGHTPASAARAARLRASTAKHAAHRNE